MERPTPIPDARPMAGADKVWRGFDLTPSLPAASWSMQAMAMLKRRSAACPIALLNYLSQVPDSAMTVGALLACPITQDFGQGESGQ